MSKAFEALFDRNVAVGESEIHSDSVIFRWRDEIWTVPTISTVGIATFNGNFYTAKVDKVRALAVRVDEMRGNGNA